MEFIIYNGVADPASHGWAPSSTPLLPPPSLPAKGDLINVVPTPMAAAYYLLYIATRRKWSSCAS
jgi:hypothetical protein